jgi:hypothetical protein
MLPSKTALSLVNRDRIGAFTLGFFACLCILIGGVGTYIALIRPVMLIVAARSWVPTPCTIIASAVKETRSDRGSPLYSIEMTYSYVFNRKPEQASQYDVFGISSSSARGWRDAVVDSLPPGRVTTCYVNPRDPSQALIDRDPNLGLLWGLLPPVIFVIGLLLLWGRYVPGQRKPEAEGVSRGRDFDRDRSKFKHAVDSASHDDGPITLAPEIPRVAGVLVGLCLTLFWNGIVGVFVYHSDQFTNGSTGWAIFFWVFMTPFLAAGAYIVWNFGKLLLGLFNPQPVLNLSCAQVPLGGSARLAWSIEGRWDTLQSLTIRLKGSETGDGASNGRIFYDDLLVERRIPGEVAAGEVEFAIPGNLMHSFSSKHASIEWKLAVDGRIPWWPGLRADFPIRVAPHE